MTDTAALHDDHADHGDHAHDDPAHNDHGHGGGIGKYLAVFVALCLLTMMSFWTFADFPVPWPYHKTPLVGQIFMMAVSCSKAMLVILFFMHVKYEANWKYVLTIPAGMMSIFLILMLIPDVGNRLSRASEERKAVMADPHDKHAEEASHDGAHAKDH